MELFDDPARIDNSLDSRSISFENPRGERGGGGTAAKGRKGSPSRLIGPGEKVLLADIEGPGRIRHLWMTFPPSMPERMRAANLEVSYDGLDYPSISVPCIDFFGLPHGRPTAYFSALTSVAEGRGFNAYFPMPFRKRLRMEFTNGSGASIPLYYQIDYTLEDVAEGDWLFTRVIPSREPNYIAKGFRNCRRLARAGAFSWVGRRHSGAPRRYGLVR